ncbi:MAG TPA: cytochrome c biogenesis protein CcsA [Myxococcota bacterium]
MTTARSPFIRFLQFLGKVKFTTILLAVGVFIMIVGTLVESSENREAAWSAVYGTLWFDVFLFLIGVNLIVAVINRIPIQRHHWPFVLTHFAIVLLLVGAWISSTFGYEGRLVIYEGSQEHRLLMDALEIRAHWQAGTEDTGTRTADSPGVDASFPLPSGRRLAGRVLQEEAEGRPEIRIAEYVPNGVAVMEMVGAGADGSPGVEFVLSRGHEHVRQWLLADDPGHGRIDLGLVEMQFRRAAPEDLSADANAHGHQPEIELVVTPSDGGDPVRIPLPARLGQAVPCGPTLVAEVKQFFLRARIVDGKLSDVATASLNPAAVVEIRSENGSETHTVFANYPEFNAMHGNEANQASAARVSLSASLPASKPLVAILLDPEQRLHVQIEGASGRQAAAPLPLGENVPLASLGLDLQLERVLESARPQLDVRPIPDGQEGGSPHVRIEARLQGERRVLWLGRDAAGRAAHFHGLGDLEVAFGAQLRPLPFAIALEEFQVVNHPGSNRPSEYWSRVQVVPSTPDIAARTERISMNRPLDVAGFRLFQSSYQLGREGRPDATILTVSYDPGVTLVYVSFILIIVGIAWGLRGVRPSADRAGQSARAKRLAQRQPGPHSPKHSAGGARAGSSSLRAPLGLLLVLLAGIATGPAQRADAGALEDAVEATHGWAILADGRVKPLLVFAEEHVLAITGREHFDGLSALEIVWGYTFAARDFAERPYVRVDSLELKAMLGLPAETRRFSFNALMGKPEFRNLVNQALQRRQQELELTRLEKDAISTYDKLGRVDELMSGAGLTVVPLPDASGSWRSIQTLPTAQDPAQQALHAGFTRLAAAYTGGDAEAFAREATSLGDALRALNPTLYPSTSRIKRELFYQNFNAFGKAWKLYLVGFLCVALLGFSERSWPFVAGTLLIGAGFACHSIGVGLRWAIAERAPVSDMYESLVFMGWGVVAFGLVTQAAYRKRFIAVAAGLTGFLCVAFAENLPIDSAINPLVPVLAHTYWLSVHVMTIMLSYSALALAMMLGHAGLFALVFQRQNVLLASSLSKVLYKTLQIGVLFLAAGIIFGAIWANESWGRYWGWDPKETWSLITMFVYLAIVHARFAGWLGHFGLSASAVLGFLAVVMTYYGVNFILAAGLHSYGFSEGGQYYAALYAVVEIGIVVGAYLRYRSLTAEFHAGPPLGELEP